MQLCVLRLQKKHVTNVVKTKPDMSQVEQCSIKATLCWHLGQELLTQFPVPLGKLEEQWLLPFAEGDSEVDNQLETVLLDRSSNFNIQRDVPILRRLVEDLNFSKPVAVTAEAEVSLTIDKWNFVEKQLKYDQAVYETWKRKCASIQQAAEQAKHEWRLQRRRQCQRAAKSFLSNCVQLLVWTTKKPEVSIAEVMNHKKVISSKTGVAQDELSYLVYWNTSVPSLIQKDVLNQQVVLLAWMLADQMASCAMVLMPVHTYNKGKLSLEEKALLERLQQSGNHNLDWSFHMIFTQKVDLRDLRPMVYSGKLVFPSPLDLAKTHV